ncbi:MAG: Ig domain-containing protein [Acetobacterium woodii]|nr:Ig domain-containing protein [Acetobacterium woodii]
MKRIKILAAVCLVLAVSLFSATSVLAQDTSNWVKNDGVLGTGSASWSGMPALETGTASNAVSTAGGPVIITQPQDVHFTIPQPANMSIVVANPETCDFQWQWQLHKEGQPDEWYDFIGEGSQRATLENKISTGLMDTTVVRCVVTSKTDASKVTVSNPATYLLDSGSPAYYATLGDQIVLMGQTVNLTGGGQASLSADGKTLTLNNAKLTYHNDYNSFMSGVGMQYAATSDDPAKAVKIELIGDNTIVADTEKGYQDTDKVRKSFADLYFHTTSGASNDRMTLTIGGTGTLLLDGPKQTPTVFDFYGLYAESFVKLTDSAKVTINNKYIGAICADLAMAENTALTVAGEVNALQLLPSYDAVGNFAMKPGAVLDAKAKMGTVVALKGDGQFTAEGATITLTGAISATDQPINEDPIVVAGVTTDRSESAEPGAGNMTLKNCSLVTNLSSNHKQVIFQQGLRVAGDLAIDGGTVTVNSEILDEAVNSQGVMGIQGANVSLKNNAVADIKVNGDNMAIGCVANDQMTIKDAGLNAIIDNSAGKFSATGTEALGIGAQHMNISMSTGQQQVNAQILGYDNGLPLVNFLDSSDTRQDYDPSYQPERLTLSDKAGFVLPIATEAVINQASLEAHQVTGTPAKKYTVYEAVYNKNNTTKGAQQVTIATTTAGNVSYSTEIQNIGWQQAVTNGAISGTTGQSLRLEAIKINLDGFADSGSIEYKSHIQNKGWEPSFKSAGQISGTVGEGLRLEAIEIQLTGAMAEKYDVYYQVHAKNFGWLNWAKNGERAGTEGQSLRLEAIRIQIVPKGTVVSSEGTNPKAYITLADL